MKEREELEDQKRGGDIIVIWDGWVLVKRMCENELSGNAGLGWLTLNSWKRRYIFHMKYKEKNENIFF